MAQELRAVRTWLDATLTSDLTLQGTLGRRWAFEISGPTDPRTRNGARYPLGIYRQIAGRDFNGVAGKRLLSVFRMAVEVVRIKGDADVSAAVTRVDSLLSDVAVQSVAVGAETYWILGSVRRESTSRVVPVESVIYEHEGGIYEITVSR